jgi:hypothetical protein
MTDQSGWHPMVLEYLAAHPIPYIALWPDIGRHLAPSKRLESKA